MSILLTTMKCECGEDFDISILNWFGDVVDYTLNCPCGKETECSIA